MHQYNLEAQRPPEEFEEIERPEISSIGQSATLTRYRPPSAQSFQGCAKNSFLTHFFPSLVKI